MTDLSPQFVEPVFPEPQKNESESVEAPAEEPTEPVEEVPVDGDGNPIRPHTGPEGVITDDLKEVETAILENEVIEVADDIDVPALVALLEPLMMGVALRAYDPAKKITAEQIAENLKVYAILKCEDTVSRNWIEGFTGSLTQVNLGDPVIQGKITVMLTRQAAQLVLDSDPVELPEPTPNRKLPKNIRFPRG